jgi:hypothetical protein
MSTEIGPNPGEFRATLRDKLASMPPVGTQGREIKAPNEPATADITPSLGVATEAPAPRMKPNPAQGATGSPVAPQTRNYGNPLEAIRAKAAGQAPLDHDPTLI